MDTKLVTVILLGFIVFTAGCISSPVRSPQETGSQVTTTITEITTSETPSQPPTSATEQKQPTQTNASNPPVRFSGTGHGFTSDVKLKTGLVTTHLTHTSDGNFIVSLVNKTSGEKTTLVDVSGEFDGTVATRVARGPYSLAVQTEGDWKMTLQQPTYSQSDVEMLPVYTTGPDYAVLGPYQSDQPLRLTINATTDENVYVALLNSDGKHVSTLIDKNGPYHDSIEFSQKGTWLLEVRVEDNWALTVKPIE